MSRWYIIEVVDRQDIILKNIKVIHKGYSNVYSSDYYDVNVGVGMEMCVARLIFRSWFSGWSGVDGGVLVTGDKTIDKLSTIIDRSRKKMPISIVLPSEGGLMTRNGVEISILGILSELMGMHYYKTYRKP